MQSFVLDGFLKIAEDQVWELKASLNLQGTLRLGRKWYLWEESSLLNNVLGR